MTAIRTELFATIATHDIRITVQTFDGPWPAWNSGSFSSPRKIRVNQYYHQRQAANNYEQRPPCKREVRVKIFIHIRAGIASVLYGMLMVDAVAIYSREWKSLVTNMPVVQKDVEKKEEREKIRAKCWIREGLEWMGCYHGARSTNSGREGANDERRRGKGMSEWAQRMNDRIRSERKEGTQIIL